jgi:membrane-associated phospholipid phosphatase
VVALGLAFGAGTAHAQTSASQARARAPIGVDAPRLTFAAAISLGVGMALSFGSAPPPARWAGNPFDDAVRDGLRLNDLDGRQALGLASDVLVIGMVAYTTFVDGLAIPLSQHGPDAAWASTAAFVLVIGLTLTLEDLVKNVVARSRPIEAGCEALPVPTRCVTLSPGMSFYSGHAALAFASAGFSCAVHVGQSLFRDVGTDGTSCGASLLAATAIGLFRLLADQHYFTDVLVGAVVGFATGYLVPVLFLPAQRSTAATASTAPTVAVLPTATVGDPGLGSLGLHALGAF